MANVKLTLGCMDYFDRTRPVLDGTVKVEGADLQCTVLKAPELFPRLGEFDLHELSSAGYLTLRAHGDDRYVGLPVFTWKSNLIGNIVVNADSGITKPQDLVGKRIGTLGVYLAGTMWILGWLRDAHGIRESQMRWVANAAPAGSVREKLSRLVSKPDTRVEEIGADVSLSDMLERGEVDAFMAPALPECFVKGSTKVRRLFPNYRELEEAESRRSRNMPLLHNLLLRRELHEKHPGLAKAVVSAFAQARQVGNVRLNNDGAFAVGLPWVRHDTEELPKMFGGDWYAPGMKANREMIETMARYAHEQGFMPKRLAPEDFILAD